MILRPRHEIVIATVSAVGTDHTTILSIIEDCLRAYAYSAVTIRMSQLLRDPELSMEIDDTSEFSRIRTSMKAGNKIRESAKDGGALALHAISEIHAQRGKRSTAEPRCFVIHSLKHPGEVLQLRRVYGASLLIVGLYSAEFERRAYLQQKGIDDKDTNSLIKDDQSEANKLGQQTRKTYQLADVFIDINKKRPELFSEMERILDLEFGHPNSTPSQAEYGMFLAFAAALRSSDLSRQVGAAILSRTGEILALGCNDVPASEGGLYWPGPEDRRDFKLGHDSNHSQRLKIVDELATKLKPHSKLTKAELVKLLKETAIADITEYGRAVHAEMDAILACARSGLNPKGSTLYTTTFPCHNCAKHIVAAGIKEVLYIEPYPKSLAKQLHEDSIVHSDEVPEESLGRRVVFKPFCGVGPRRYPQLFSISWSLGYEIIRKDDESGRTPVWQRKKAAPRIPLIETGYVEREKLSVLQLMEDKKNAGQGNQGSGEKPKPVGVVKGSRGRSAAMARE